jgi:hypothetical protein
MYVGEFAVLAECKDTPFFSSEPSLAEEREKKKPR